MSPSAVSVTERPFRRRILKTGVMAYSGGHVTLQCVVRDLSDGGARLLVEGSISAPDTFVLSVPTDGLEANCRVVWRRGKEVGVAFEGAIRQLEKRRSQVIQPWSNASRPSLRKHPKPPIA